MHNALVENLTPEQRLLRLAVEAFRRGREADWNWLNGYDGLGARELVTDILKIISPVSAA